MADGDGDGNGDGDGDGDGDGHLQKKGFVSAEAEHTT